MIVADMAEQDSVVKSLQSLFEHTTVIDRREKPSHGYRAIHVVVKHHGKLIEIQVRTALQHLWAELSEKYSDVENPAIKYGGGDEETQANLIEASALVTSEEEMEKRSMDMIARLSSQNNSMEERRLKIIEFQAGLHTLRQDIFNHLRSNIDELEN